MKKTKYSDFFGPEKSSNPKIFLFLKFSNSGQPSRLFKKMGLCDFSVNGTPIDKLLNFTCNKMKKEKQCSKKIWKICSEPKKQIEKKLTKKWCFFFFEVPTDKNIFAARFFFFQFPFVFLFFWPSIPYRSLKRLGVVAKPISCLHGTSAFHGNVRRGGRIGDGGGWWWHRQWQWRWRRPALWQRWRRPSLWCSPPAKPLPANATVAPRRTDR